MKFISLFAGIGGFDLGFERAGMQCVAQVEINEWCQRVLTKHWPDVPKFGDIKDVGKHNLPSADLVCGGFPCQPHSTAGKRKGAADDRNLWPEYFRIIKELEPSWVVAENVPGIVTTYLDKVLSDLGGIEYETIAISIPAAAFDAGHARERIFIIANRCGNISQEVCKGFEETSKIHGERTCSYINRSPLPEGVFGRDYSLNYRNGNGVPDRVDRIRGLGNAVVPQVAEFIGKLIMEIENETRQ